MFARERVLADGGPFEIDLRRPVRIEHHAEAQAAIGAQRHAAVLHDVLRQGIQGLTECGHRIIAENSAAADDGGIVGMGFSCGLVGGEVGQALRQPLDAPGQVA